MRFFKGFFDNIFIYMVRNFMNFMNKFSRRNNICINIIELLIDNRKNVILVKYWYSFIINNVIE